MRFACRLVGCLGLVIGAAMSTGAVWAQGDLPVSQPLALEGARVSVTLEGFVLGPDGSPAGGVVVVSSAGGRAVTDAAGSYRLEVEVPLEVTSVQVTAVGSAGRNLVAHASAPIRGAASATRVDPLELTLVDSCSPSWLPTFGHVPGIGGTVFAVALYDDGGGPELYVGGDFTTAGGVAASRIAKWDGTNWSAVGGGVNSTVYSLLVHDDGGGPELYAAGSFTLAGGTTMLRVAKWDGTSWTTIGNGVNGTVYTLAVHDDGSGPALYAGGTFTKTGGVVVNHIARWNGTIWAQFAPGGGMNAAVRALAVFDGGSGPVLCAGGEFTTAGGTAANRIAKWNGSSWSAFGGGMNGAVRALAVYDAGAGPRLHAAGEFTTAGGSANRIARWSGASWSGLGSGMNDSVHALAVYDDGAGPALHAGGAFTTANGTPADRLAKWNGSSWTAFGSGMNGTVHALAAYEGGAAAGLYAGGVFSMANGLAAFQIARWDGSSWSAFGTGINSTVEALAVYDDGGGPALYAGGSFTSAGGETRYRIAKWDGSSWAALGSGVDGPYPLVRTLAVYDDGSGPALYVGGNFASAGGVAANRIARWNGSSWSALGSGVSEFANTIVHCLAVYDDGSGPALYVGGGFTSAGGVAANAIAKWDGSSWSALGSGMTGFSGAAVSSLAVYDDGSGPGLYAGGVFTHAGGVVANGIARWNGSSWSALGSGVGLEDIVVVLAVHDDGGGQALYAGGGFTSIGGVFASRIARWNGAGWAAVGGGMNETVSTLLAHDDGSGLALYAGGYFTSAGGAAANRIAKWNGSSWSALGSGMNGGVVALAHGAGPALYAGGGFSIAFGSLDSFLARWDCPDTTPPVLSCPSSVSVIDRILDGAGESVSFTVTASDDSDPAPLVVCVPPSGSTFTPGTTLVSCTATDASGNQSTCEFPVTVAPKARER